MRKTLQKIWEKANSFRFFVLIVLLTCITVNIAYAAVPLELQRLYKASSQDNITADTFMGGLNVCTDAGGCKTPYSGTATTLSYILGTMTGVTQDSTLSYHLGPPIQGQSYLSYTPGAAGSATNYIAMVTNGIPFKATDYVADVYQNLRIPGAEPAYAQGLGFSSLSPALGLWKLFRNLAYFFFVVIFLFVGMMIMFRSQIGDKAAVTVQQALPKMIVSLLLVTFSYAIAGLMVEIMYMTIYLAIAIFQSGNALSIQKLTEVAFRENFITNTFGLLNDGAVGTIASALGNIVVGALNIDQGILAPLAGGATAIVNVIFVVVLAFALLMALFRVFFALVQAYIMIFFTVIFAPLILLIGALPGQNTFGTWIKGLIENLMVFPVIIILIFIGYYFTKVSFTTSDALGFSPPQLGSNQTDGGFQVYSALIPFAAIMAMPDVLKLVKGLMKGQIDINIADQLKRVQTAGQTAAPVLGAPINAVTGGIRGALTARNQGISVIEGAYQGGKRGLYRGYQRGQSVARVANSLIEGRFANPDDTSELLRRFSSGQESVKEARKKDEDNRPAETPHQ
jgi:hypothetical protein